MEIKKVKTIYFSPTGTSKKIVRAIGEGGGRTLKIEEFDLTFPDHAPRIEVAENELAIVGVPVYAGRVAPLAKERLKSVYGSNSNVIIAVLYGNREFEDALIELRDMMMAQSFSVIAACAFVGEHSFSSAAMPIGQGRPDDQDLVIANEFGQKVMEQMSTYHKADDGLFNVPGDTPYKEGMMNLPFTPQIDIERCTQCEACIPTCPARAISLEDQIRIDREVCTFCCACIKNCPEGVVSITAPPILEKVAWLHANCQERKEPKLFL